VATAAVAASGFVLATAGPAQAWKPPTVVDAATEMADDLFGIIVTTALNLIDLNPAVRAALDKDGDGRINPSEALDVFANPEDFLSNEALFPPDQFPGGCGSSPTPRT
jgi:hypothetical protein